MYSLLAGIGLLVRPVSYCLSHCAQRAVLAQYDPNMIRWRDERRKKARMRFPVLGLKLGPRASYLWTSDIWVLGVTKEGEGGGGHGERGNCSVD